MFTDFARQTTRLRFTLLLTTLLGTAALLQNCKGPQGDPGPDGADGVNGRDGNANVTYTAWTTPTWDTPYRGSFSYELSLRNTASPILTQAAIDRGLIHVYYKLHALEWDGTGYAQQERIAEASAGRYHYVKIPGRTANRFEDYTEVYIGTPYLSVNRFSPFVQIMTHSYNYNTRTYEPVVELVGKDISFYQGLVRTMPQYRIVVAHGTTPARMKAIDWSDYEVVKKTFNLPD